jgi:hypothetical protein
VFEVTPGLGFATRTGAAVAIPVTPAIRENTAKDFSFMFAPKILVISKTHARKLRLIKSMT